MNEFISRAGAHLRRWSDDVRRWPRAVRWSLAGLGGAMLAVLVFFGQPNWDWARGILAGTLSGRMHRPVHIDGHVRVMLFSASPRIILTGFRIGEPPSGMPDAPRVDLATVDSLVAQLVFAHLWFRAFVYGPLEWLWRAATYLTVKVPFRKGPAQPA